MIATPRLLRGAVTPRPGLTRSPLPDPRRGPKDVPCRSSLGSAGSVQRRRPLEDCSVGEAERPFTARGRIGPCDRTARPETRAAPSLSEVDPCSFDMDFSCFGDGDASSNGQQVDGVLDFASVVYGAPRRAAERRPDPEYADAAGRPR